ncbi:MAG TPA: flagellar basal body rod protein, partial [Catenuloplanes sp.]
MSTNDKPEAAEPTPAKSKKKLLVMIIAVVLLAAAGGGGYFMLTGGGKDKAPAAEAGAVVALEAVTINLADGHYLKLAFALQATAEAAEEPDGSKALDLAIGQYTDMKVAELSTAEG